MSHVVLVCGRGGIGKTRLLQRFGEIVSKDAPDVAVAWVDWELMREQRPAEFAHGRDHAPVMLRVIEQHVREVLLTAGEPSMPAQHAATALRRAWERRAGVEDLPISLPKVSDAVDDASEGAVDVTGFLAEGALAGAQRYDHVIIALGSYLRALSAAQPILVVLDTSEIVAGDRHVLIELARWSGSRVAFLIALRAEEGGAVTEDPVVTAFNRRIPERRRRVIELHRFDDETVGAYLKAHLPDEPSDDLVAAVAAVTRGIPLAVSLVTPLLAKGVPSHEVLEPITEDGAPSEVIQELAERFLLHVREDPELRRDEPLLFGLASVYGEHAETEVLKALWDIKGELAPTMDGLAKRHDFVLSRTRRLHNDVKDIFLRYLQEPTRRADMVSAHRRAVDVILARLVDLRDSVNTTEELLETDEWSKWSTALLWHRFWMGNEYGMQLLYELYPLALRHRRSLVTQYRRVASWFEPTMTASERSTLSGLRALSDSPFISRLLDQLASRNRSRRARLFRDADLALQRLRVHKPILLPPLLPTQSSGSALSRVSLRNAVRSGDAHAMLRAAEDAVAVTMTDADAPERDELASLLDEVEQLLDRNGSPPLDMLRIGQLTTAVSPERPANWSMLSEYLRRSGESDASEQSATFAIELGLVGARPWWSIAEASRLRGDEEARQAAIDQALEHGLRLMIDRVTAELVEAERFEDAEALLRRAIELHPESSVAATELARFLYHHGDRGLALAEFERAVDLDPTRALAHAQLGQARESAGDYEGAETSYERSIDIEPNKLAVSLSLARLLARLDRKEEALTILERTAGQKTDVPTQRLRSQLLSDLKRYDECIQSLVVANSLDDVAESYAELGAAILRDGNAALAAAAYAHARKLEPSDPGWRLREAHARVLAGDPDAGLAIVNELPEGEFDAIAFDVRGMAFGTSGQHHEAARDFRRAREIDPDRPGLHSREHAAWIAAHSHATPFGEEAYEVALQWLAREPNSGEANGAAAQSLIVLDRAPEALALAKRFLALDPNDVVCLNALAIAYQRLGDDIAATEAFERLTELQPNSSNAWCNLGEVLLCVAAANDDPTEVFTERALEALRRCLELDAPLTACVANLLLGLATARTDAELSKGYLEEARRLGDPRPLKDLLAKLLTGDAAALDEISALGFRDAGEVALARTLVTVGRRSGLEPVEVWDVLDEKLARLDA